MVFRVAIVNGRRIFDIEHLFKQILNGKKHEPFECSIILRTGGILVYKF